jgi:hypothetical protein
MTRITNDLFEAIRKVTAGQQEHQLLNEEMKEKEEKGEKKHKEEKEEMDEGQVDKAHYCATHVEHAIFGEGECIAEAHADPDADGNIAWYTVKFNDGIRKVYTEAMKVKKAKMHEHAEVTDEMIDQEVADLSEEEFEQSLQEALALDEASYSAKAARAGKDIGKPGKMFSKIAASAAKRYGSEERGKKVAGAVLAKLRAKNMEEGAMSDLDADRKDRAYQTRQAKTTMKHISNPTPGEKAAAKDIKPGIAGYRDRIAMLKSAQARGALKEDEVTEGKGDGNLANNYPPYDKVTRGDVVSGRLGKDHMGGKNKRAMVKETLTLIYEQDIDVEIPAELTFADYLDAVKSLAKDDPTISEADIIKMATLAHKENDVDVVLEAAYNRTREGDKMYSPELDADIDRSKPGVTRFSRRIKSGEGMGVKQSERKLMKRIASRNK